MTRLEPRSVSSTQVIFYSFLFGSISGKKIFQFVNSDMAATIRSTG